MFLTEKQSTLAFKPAAKKPPAKKKKKFGSDDEDDSDDEFKIDDFSDNEIKSLPKRETRKKEVKVCFVVFLYDRIVELIEGSLSIRGVWSSINRCTRQRNVGVSTVV